MTTCFRGPDPLQSTFFIPGGNTVGNGVQLFIYAAGSSTKTTVYKDNAGSTAWTNPIVLDSGGNLPSSGSIWIPTGVTIKVIYAPSTDTDPPASPYITLDNISGINDTGSATTSEWIAGPSPSFVNSTQFTLAGDQTGTFTAGRRLRTTNTAGTVYSVIASAVFGTSTTVNVVSDSGALDSGLSAVSYGIADPANPSISPQEIYRKGTAVASAGNGTTNIWGIVGDYVHVTGTNNIFGFSTAPYAGAAREVVFDSSLEIMSSAAISIPQNRNMYVNANDIVSVRADTVSTHTITKFSSIGKNSHFGNFVLAASTSLQSAITGVGFQPSAVLFLGSITNSSAVSIGFDTTVSSDTVGALVANNGGSGPGVWAFISGNSVHVVQNSSNIFNMKVISTNGDGFTVTTDASGSSSSAAQISVAYIALR